MPFYTYVQKHIFEVLGMDHTIHWAQQDNPAVAEGRSRIQGYTTKLKLIKKSRVYLSNPSYIDHNGQPLSQISPDAYVSVYSSGFMYFVRNAGGEVIKFSNPYNDFFCSQACLHKVFE
ncbi:hypothetical protein P40081_03970 [Paenibacillus sp. FSL P4-0081]|nr:hypothetical protein P40081_03970 [Paenibacillus sp. FSL P4-0081]